MAELTLGTRYNWVYIGVWGYLVVPPIPHSLDSAFLLGTEMERYLVRTEAEG